MIESFVASFVRSFVLSFVRSAPVQQRPQFRGLQGCVDDCLEFFNVFDHLGIFWVAWMICLKILRNFQTFENFKKFPRLSLD